MSPVTAAPAADVVSVAGVELEVLRRGTGNPLLLLHGFQHVDPRRRSSNCSLVTSSSSRRRTPASAALHVRWISARSTTWFISISLFSTPAAEAAHADGALVRRLARRRNRGQGGTAHRQADSRRRPRHQGERPRNARHTSTCSLTSARCHREELARSRTFAPRYDDMEDDELVARSRNWETLARYGFHPYMHNPQLKRWLPTSRRARWCCGAHPTAW